MKLKKWKEMLTKHHENIWLGSLVCLGLLCLFFCGTPTGRAIASASPKKDFPIYCVQREEKVVSLSFDAAWGNEDTKHLIDILDKYGVRATFFVIGNWVRKYPETVKQLHDSGQEVMSHSDKHKHMTKLTKDEITADIKTCEAEIEKLTGVKPFLFRPPYGEYDNKVVGTLRELGYYTIQWDVDSLDWKNRSASEIASRVLGKVKPGSIVLFHNAGLNTPDALPAIIEGLMSKGYSFVPISEIIYREDFTINHEGRQIPNKPATPAE